MHIEGNKSLVRRFFEILNDKEHPNALEGIVDPNCRLDGEACGVRGLQQLVVMMRSALPDEAIAVEDLIAEGDVVAARLTSRGTHQGSWPSPIGPIPPSGRSVTQTGIQLFRIRGHRIVELWSTWDVLGLLRQLDALPAAQEVGA